MLPEHRFSKLSASPAGLANEQMSLITHLKVLDDDDLLGLNMYAPCHPNNKHWTYYYKFTRQQDDTTMYWKKMDKVSMLCYSW